nr:hypothetical protein [Tanacetum cinerariifolium]
LAGISKEDVQNMLQIVLVAKIKVEALQVKYPLINWEIHFEGSRSYWKIIRVGGIIEAYQSFEDMLKIFDREDLELDANEDVTLVDVDTAFGMDADTQGRIEEDVTAVKELNDAEPTVFYDEQVTMTMAQTLIKMKAKKQRILDEQTAKRMQDEELEQAAAREKQEKEDLERAKVLQKQYDQKQENINWNGMTYDHVRPIFKREYNYVQTFLKSDGDEQPAKKSGAEETLLQESFKKLRAEVEVSGSSSTQQDTPTVDLAGISKEDVQNMLQIVLVAKIKVEALQVKYPLIKWEIHFEGSRSYWKIIRVGGIIEAYQSFEDMLKFFDREDLEKDYPLTDVVLLLMLSAKLQVDEDCEMARDLVMKIFMEANKPKSIRSLDTSSN